MLQEEVVLQKEVVLLESLLGVQVLGLVSVVSLNLIQGSKAKVNSVKKIVLPSCFHTTNDI